MRCGISHRSLPCSAFVDCGETVRHNDQVPSSGNTGESHCTFAAPYLPSDVLAHK